MRVNKMAEDLKAQLALDAKKAKAAKAKARKLNALDLQGDVVPTFGPLIPEEISHQYYGFLYLVYVSVNGESERVYAGSKSYHDRKHPWQTYITSGAISKQLILASRSFPDTVKVRLVVVDAKQQTASWQKAAESKLIWDMYRLYGKDRCINIRDAHGVSLRTGKMIGKKS